MGRMTAVAKKEVRELLRDPITLGIAIFLPVIMMFLFSYAITLDVREIRLAVLDQDQSAESRDYLFSYLESGYFRLEAYANNPQELERLLDDGAVRMALIIPPDFSRRLRQGLPAEIQTLLDGSFANTAIVASNYVAAIDEIHNTHLQSEYLEKRVGTIEVARAIKSEPRIRFNPGLKSANFIIPGLFAVILMAFPPMLTALAVVREKERGSMRQILATPIAPWEFICGKTLPYTGIAFLEMLLLLALGYFWFNVTVVGSLLLLLWLSLLYVLCTVGIGLVVSTLTHSQVVAVLLAIVLTLMPSFLFSGFLFPIASMPDPFRYYTYLFPARYFNDIARGIVLKGIGIEHLWIHGAWLLFYALAVLMIATMRFSKRIG